MTRTESAQHRGSRCQQELSRLRMLVLRGDSLLSSGYQAAEIRQATNAVIAEAEAASNTALGIGGHQFGAEAFLWVRVARLATAADRAVDAAHTGDLPAARAHLRHFDTLISAFWTVRNAMHGLGPAIDRLLPESAVATAADLRRSPRARRAAPALFGDRRSVAPGQPSLSVLHGRGSRAGRRSLNPSPIDRAAIRACSGIVRWEPD
jgi:hypothetical protein